MTRFVALFRGINVGKAKRVPMAELRTLLESLGYSGVGTLLNSGNAVFASPSRSSAKHAATIRQAVAKQMGVDAPVIVKSAEDIAAVVDGNELTAVATDASRLLVALTQDDKSLAALQPVHKAAGGSERVQLGDHAVYVWCADGILESKAAIALLKGFGQACTTRNWATIAKIHALLQHGA